MTFLVKRFSVPVLFDNKSSEDSWQMFMIVATDDGNDGQSNCLGTGSCVSRQ